MFTTTNPTLLDILKAGSKVQFPDDSSVEWDNDIDAIKATLPCGRSWLYPPTLDSLDTILKAFDHYKPNTCPNDSHKLPDNPNHNSCPVCHTSLCLNLHPQHHARCTRTKEHTGPHINIQQSKIWINPDTNDQFDQIVNDYLSKIPPEKIDEFAEYLRKSELM